MKKIFIFLLGLFFVSVQTFADTRAQALLLHNGQGKSFDADQLQQAINEAVSGDTICLSEGTFDTNSALTIDKAIAIVGTGQTTKVRGDINIAIDGAPKVTIYMLDAMRITGDVIVTKEQHGLKIRKCWIGGYLYSTETLTDLQVDRCYVLSFVPLPSVKSALFMNSIFFYIGEYNSKKVCNSTGNELTFYNCNIGQLNCVQGKLQDMTFVNSILANYYSYIGKGNNTLINCLSKYELTTYYGDNIVNCYINSLLGTKNDDSYNNFFPTFNINSEVLTEELLTKNNYIGNDGTVVGVMGGTNPYTLTPDGISIKESVLRVDPETRKLNVTLKVASE